MVDAAVEAAVRDRFVFPGDPEEVDGVEVPEAGLLQARLDLGGDARRVFLLLEGRDDDVALPAALDRLLQLLLVDLQVNHADHLAPPCNGDRPPLLRGGRES